MDTKRKAVHRNETLPASHGVMAHTVSDLDQYLFGEGNHFRLWDCLGAHAASRDGRPGTQFAVWAPSARSVSVIGDFNGWDPRSHALSPNGSSGIWSGFVAGVEPGAIYKYHILSQDGQHRVDKADPFAFQAEVSPRTGSVVSALDYEWHDHEWMRSRHERQKLTSPISIYELHLGSWRRVPEEGYRSLSYREMAPYLVKHLQELGFTHVEFLPVMEHPFFASWGYQVTGYFAPSARFGTPQDLMFLIDQLHQAGIGVILDWVPSHFPKDEHGLAYFDGTHLFEHADPRQGLHPDWDSSIFNYGRHEVRSFLISSALFWLSVYHADALRVDAVASMLYLDYSRQEGEWIPNPYGGRENLDAIYFLRKLNEVVYATHPDVQTIAEESTAWPMVSRPTHVGGLGFGLKWDMGWMHDTLRYMSHDPVHRKYHHQDLTFRMLYAYHENFVLPLSHDEVVHGKGSLLGKMPGDEWQKFANLRLLYALMYASSGKKLLFMGCELGAWDEWQHDGSLDWHLLDFDRHRAIFSLVRDLNALYRNEASLHELDCDPDGFHWIDPSDSMQSCLSLLRKSRGDEWMLVALNFTPVPRHNYCLGVPRAGFWREVLNTDAGAYGGSGQGNLGGLHTQPEPSHGHGQSLVLTLPPLGATFLKWG
jgi:1,4-alpha-glucan branching enzyme